MAPLPTIFVLEDIRVYVCSSDGHNITVYIEVSINKTFSLTTTLYILDINSNYGHIQFG